jgi:hypothetical protein
VHEGKGTPMLGCSDHRLTEPLCFRLHVSNLTAESIL